MGDYWDATIASFSNLITKPTLKPQLLQKPPFRFLHDIVTNTLAATGFPQGLFAEDQYNSENVKEKDQKLSFLDRLISAIQLINNESFVCAPSKVIAGLEPENTNVMLQHLAIAAKRVRDGQANMADIVRRVDAGDKPGASRSATSHTTPSAASPTSSSASHSHSAAPSSSASASSSSRRNAAGLPIVRAPIQLPGATGPEDFVATTQRVLGALIQKPKMVDKLLRKPPFRFIHDIVTNMIATTSFPNDCFTPFELDSANITETQAKCDFLQKFIDIVATANGVDLSSVNPKKIAAGLEPEQTNLLLQQFAYAAASGVNGKDVFAKYAGAHNANNEDAAAAARKREEEQRRRQAEEAQRAQQAQAQAQAAAAAAAAPLMPKLNMSEIEKRGPTGGEDEQFAPKQESATENMAPQRLERPKTARQGPPRQRSNLLEEKKKQEDEKRAAEQASAALIQEGEVVADDDDDQGDNNTLSGGEPLQGFEDDPISKDKAGKVMRNILNTLEQGDNKGQPKLKLSSSAKASSSNVLSVQQLDDLRTNIQKCCQSINPLGKCIEFVYEDFDAMTKEVNRWKKAYGEYTDKLEQETKSTEGILEPLTTQLSDLDQTIIEQQRKIHALKAQIIKNDQQIQSLLEAKSSADSY